RTRRQGLRRSPLQGCRSERRHDQESDPPDRLEDLLFRRRRLGRRVGRRRRAQVGGEGRLPLQGILRAHEERPGRGAFLRAREPHRRQARRQDGGGDRVTNPTRRKLARGHGSARGPFVSEPDLAGYVEKAATPQSAGAFKKLMAKALSEKLKTTGGTRACPVCGVHLERFGFGEHPFVILDRCTKHGVWLDRTELKKVV